MKILAVDTSTRCGSLAILHDARVMVQVSSQEDTLYSERLFRDLARLQTMSQFQLKEIDLFAVSTGPGSFTGLRIGLTAVKAWAELYQKPVAGVSGLLAVAAQSKANTGAVAPFLDARRGQIYGAIYQRSPGNHVAWQLLGEEAVLSAEEFLTRVKGELGKELPTLVSPTPEVLDPALQAAMLPGSQIESVSEILAPVVGTLGFQQARHGELQNALTLDANYIRRSDAELFWKAPR
jgi:tRNA threonylcarbamoyladenosine biosynthesis protein TsaB